MAHFFNRLVGRLGRACRYAIRPGRWRVYFKNVRTVELARGPSLSFCKFGDGSEPSQLFRDGEPSMSKYIVRYGTMRAMGVLSTRGGQTYGRGTKVIARTDRGLEAGEVLCDAEPRSVQQLKDPASGHILREMTSDDANELAHMRAKEQEEFETCKRYVEKLGLPMQLVDIEHIFGGERIVVYYLAESRVDFRELVKKLAQEFQTRIEMRQIGVRDEAKLLADFGDCGKAVCCGTHLVGMPPVSMKMAKLQKATLDPTKISGRCGRLKCCLRFEFETYERMNKELPPAGSEVEFEGGKGKVVGQELLAGQVLVATDDHRRILLGKSDVLSFKRPARGKGKGNASSGKPGGRKNNGRSGDENGPKNNKT